jgi:hypothetical protein
MAVLIPCFWQPHIQASDLPSHLYNAWLARQMSGGKLPGLVIAPVWTNVLADWTLSALLGFLNPTSTERVFVSAMVLIFFWGAFCFVRQVTNRLCWPVAPLLGMLAYGLIFHLGFLNFYLSTGFCLWIMALLWRPTWKRVACAAPLAMLAVLAHAMPLLWAAVVLGYTFVARHAPSWLRLALPVVSLAAIAALAWVLPHLSSVRFMRGIPGPGPGITGADQMWLFGPKYLIVSFGLLLIWSLLMVKRIDQGGFLHDPFVQIWLLHMAAFVVLPAAIQFSQYEHPLAYIPQRISLFIGLLTCSIVAEVCGRRAMAVSVGLAVLYFAFVFTDSRAHNLVERRVAELVAKLPPGKRVVAVISEPASAVQSLLHVVDRACIEHCFSYGNYEAATKQFRLRALGPNPYVASSMAEVKQIEAGAQIVTPEEAPLYTIFRSGPGFADLSLRQLKAGDRIDGSVPVED